MNILDELDDKLAISPKNDEGDASFAARFHHYFRQKFIFRDLSFELYASGFRQSNYFPSAFFHQHFPSALVDPALRPQPDQSAHLWSDRA